MFCVSTLFLIQVDRASGGVGVFPQYIQAGRKAAFGVPKREFLEVGGVGWRGEEGGTMGKHGFRCRRLSLVVAFRAVNLHYLWWVPFFLFIFFYSVAFCSLPLGVVQQRACIFLCVVFCFVFRACSVSGVAGTG